MLSVCLIQFVANTSFIDANRIAEEAKCPVRTNQMG